MRLKRNLSLLSLVALIVFYFIATDPDTSLLKDLPWGVDLVLTIGIFIVVLLGIIIIEFVPDFFIDAIYGKENELVKNAKTTPEGAGYALIAKSLRILGYCIIAAGAIVAYNIR